MRYETAPALLKTVGRWRVPFLRRHDVYEVVYGNLSLLGFWDMKDGDYFLNGRLTFRFWNTIYRDWVSERNRRNLVCTRELGEPSLPIHTARSTVDQLRTSRGWLPRWASFSLRIWLLLNTEVA